MLTFLALASREQLVVDRYEDEAIGFLGKDAAGRLAMTKVTLRPRVAFGGEKVPGPEEVRLLHVRAHHG